MHVAEGAGPERRTVAFPVPGQELALESSHVDVHGAFGLAGAALEAQIEDLAHLAVAETCRPHLARHREAEDIGTAPRRVRLLARGHVGRAHRAVERLAADTKAAAHLDGAGHPAVRRVVEEGHGPGCHVTSAVAQVRGQRRRVHDLPGVEQALRVERLFHLTECPVEHRSEHLLHERAAHQPVAVLPRQRTTELHHEVGDLAGNRFERPDACLGLEVHHGAHVQASHRRMGVHARRRLVPPDDVQEPCDVVAQPFRSHRRVLHERQRLRIVLRGHREAECGLAHAPDPRLRRRFERVVIPIAEAPAAQVRFECVEARRQVVGGIRVELDAQERTGLTIDEGLAEPVQRRVLAGVVQDEAVHHLNGGWPVGENGRRRFERTEKIGELDRHHGFRGRQRHERKRRVEHHAERAFRADHQPRQVESRDAGVPPA